MESITKDLLKEIFEYHEDGYLIWKIRPSNNKIKKGDKAGFLQLEGKTNKRRCVIGINRKLYKASRLIFLLHNGYLPDVVDHKDRDTLNDKIENLRAATNSENNRNRTSKKGSASKYIGVSFSKHAKKWQASIQSDKKPKHLGYFNEEKDAAIRYNEFAIKLHGRFANQNIITK